MPLRVLQDEPPVRPLRPPVRRIPRARGTKTSLIEHRQFRLHAPGEQPWRGRADDHRDKVNVERHGDGYVVFKPAVGAVSALDERDYVAFNVFLATRGEHDALVRCYRQMGAPEEGAKRRATRLRERLIEEGWLRTELPDPDTAPLQSVYFTVTRWCDRGCPYCYQGLNDRHNTDMTFEQVELAIERIKAVNPKAQLNVTGGEPFSHSRILDILDLISKSGFSMVILTNGTYVDRETARYLTTLNGLKYVQISIDGIRAETHEITRGKGHFPKVMAAIHNVAEEGLPFMLAPTLHEGNQHDLPEIFDLAFALGGWVTPNPLKELPHAGLNYSQVTMSNATLHRAMSHAHNHVVEKYGMAAVLLRKQQYAGYEPDVCSVKKPNQNFICGMAHSLIDLDWNGDIYPCHLNKGREMVIGNIFEQDFDVIFQRVEERGMRVKSHEIEQCSGCKFGSTCAGGCRAGAYFTYATFEHPDEHCEVRYTTALSELLHNAGLK